MWCEAQRRKRIRVTPRVWRSFVVWTFVAFHLSQSDRKKKQSRYQRSAGRISAQSRVVRVKNLCGKFRVKVVAFRRHLEFSGGVRPRTMTVAMAIKPIKHNENKVNLKEKSYPQLQELWERQEKILGNKYLFVCV